MNRKLKIAIVLILMLVLIGSVIYLTQYSPAQSQATDLLNGTDNVSVIETDYGLLLDGSGNDSLLIFYPGAKVEYTSYLPLLMNLADNGVDCALVQMPFNMAFFAENAADSIIDNTNYSKYILSGHSLGGYSATSYINTSGKSNGVVLLASYPNSQIYKPVLSIYGSQDKILNFKTYNESKVLIDNLTEFIIDGGNHGQFAYYGHHDGDGVASITPERQQNVTADKILEFINSL